MIEELVAGDTLDFTVEVPDYPATDGWTLKYRLTPRFTTPTQTPIVLTASTNADGTRYDVQAAPVTTAAWTAGYYTWARWVEKAGARQTLDESGQLQIKADPSSTAQGFDARSQARKAVDDLRAAMATFQATSGRVKSYTIGTRSMEFETSAEILKMLHFWENELRREESAERLRAGTQMGNKLHVRFR